MRRALITLCRLSLILTLMVTPALLGPAHAQSNRGDRGSDRDSYDRDGYDRDGYDRDGYDRDGYDRDGYDRDGCDRDGRDRRGRRRPGHGGNGGSGGGGGHDDDVKICHRTGNGGSQTIEVDEHAVWAHLRHGDTLGPCTASGSR